MRFRFLLAVGVILTFSACEDSMFLKSEKKMKEDIQGSWLRNFQGRDIYISNCPSGGDTIYVREEWNFTGNMLHTTFQYSPALACDRGTVDLNTSDDIDTVVISQFKIDTRIFDAFLKFQIISGANDSVITFPDKWEFITLDDDLLYLATDNPSGTSVLQLEFSKIK
jgi:hypothetical protein